MVGTTVTLETSRQYAIPAEQIFVILADLDGHFMRILPKRIDMPQYTVGSDEESGATVVEFTIDQRRKRASYRHRVEIDRANLTIILDDDDHGRREQFSVHPLSETACELRIVATVSVENGVRGKIQALLLRRDFQRTGTEIFDNLETYRKTLGSRVV